MRPEHRLKLGTLVHAELIVGHSRLATVMGVWHMCHNNLEKTRSPGICPTSVDDVGGYLLMMCDTGEWAYAFFVDETIGYIKAVNMDS